MTFYDFHNAIYEANFRATLTGFKYKVSYDKANKLWAIFETRKLTGNRERYGK